MSFTNGFVKTAGFWGSAKDIGKAFGEGVKSTGGHTIGDTLKPWKAKKFFDTAAKNAGGAENLYKTHQGRVHLARAIGEAVPAAAVTAGYAAGAKKVWDKLSKRDEPQYGYGYGY